MHLLIPYDITDNKRRRLVEKVLLAYGVRVNYSVFEITTTKVNFRKILKELKKVSDPKQDHIRIYVLNKDSIKKSFVLHSNKKVFEYEELYF